MFELPKIVCVGAAEDVILGVAFLGADMDGSCFIPDLENMDDYPVPPIGK